jgi:hypothetical protein
MTDDAQPNKTPFALCVLAWRHYLSERSFGAASDQKWSPAIPDLMTRALLPEVPWQTQPSRLNMFLPITTTGYHVRPIYKSYPVYHPDKEPHGYLNSLENKETGNCLRRLTAKE